MIMKRKIFFLLIVLLGTSSVSFAQKEVRKQLRDGNKKYETEHYTESEIAYRKALEANSRSEDAAYNLGNSLYKQGKFQEAVEQYRVVLNASKDKDKAMQAKAWHNVGNVFMNAQDYAKSVEAYKHSLINNPSDNETRYNLAVAQKLLKDQEQQEQDPDNQDKDKEQEKKEDEKKEQQQNQEQQKQDQQEQQQNNSGMDRQKAEQILNALSQDEKNTQSKVKKEEAQKAAVRKTDKDW